MLSDKLGKVGVIFDSGAFYGAFGVGAAKAIWGRGIRPVALGGASVGALNAAKIAQNNGPDGVRVLEETWLQIEKTGPSAVFNKWSAVKKAIGFGRDPTAIYGSDELEALVSEDEMDVHKIIHSDTLLQVVVTEKSNYSPELISNRDDALKANPELLRDYIRASASVPGAFPPVLINGRYYADGLIFSPLLKSFAEFGCDTIFVVMNDQKLNLEYANDHWDVEIFRVIRSMQNEVNKIGVQNFLENRPDFHAFDYEAEDDDPIIFKGLKKIKNWLTTIVEGNFDGIRHQLIVIFPHCRIPTLYATKFKKGDITLAIQRSFEETNRILDKLEKQ